MLDGRRKWIVAGPAVVVAAAIAISVVLLLNRADPAGDPQTLPATVGVNEGVDPCLVGRWQMVAATETITDGGLTLEMKLTEGGVRMVLYGNGTGTYDLAGKPTYTGSAGGKAFKVVQTGNATSTFTARDGVLHEEVDLHEVIQQLYIDGELTPPITPEPQANESSYTCDETSLVVWMDHLRQEYRRG